MRILPCNIHPRVCKAITDCKEVTSRLHKPRPLSDHWDSNLGTLASLDPRSTTSWIPVRSMLTDVKAVTVVRCRSLLIKIFKQDKTQVYILITLVTVQINSSTGFTTFSPYVSSYQENNVVSTHGVLLSHFVTREAMTLTIACCGWERGNTVLCSRSLWSGCRCGRGRGFD